MAKSSSGPVERGRGRGEADFLDEVMAARTARNAGFPQMVQAAFDRRHLLRALAAERARARIPQQAVARRMRTSQPAVARLESGEVDARLSTVERYAAAVGRRLRYELVPASVLRARPRRRG